MAATIEETAGKVVGRDPKPDAFETTLAGKPDNFYAGWRLLSGGCCFSPAGSCGSPPALPIAGGSAASW